jgi:CheY-like chemotaxis protein
MPFKLLLAEDNVTVQRVIETTFAREDVEVIVAASREQAIARMEAERPDIVLTDTDMSDGHAVAEIVKSRPQLAGIPVVLLTGAPLDEGRIRQSGCDGMLVKPFEPQALVAAVKALLGRRTQHGIAGEPQEGGTTDAREGGTAAAGESAGPPAEVPGRDASRDPLEAYFDRLDAAFASFAASPARRKDAEGGERSATPAAGDAAAAPGDPLAAWDPGFHGGSASRWQPSLANAFVAMFAPERGAATPGPAQIPGEIIDEIARRVVARLGEESMRRLILETAERIVREEIEKIKQASGSNETHSAG